VPTYQYACTECGHAFEQFQSFSDDALTQCPECQGRLRKVFNAVGVVFKGSGFYRNDSRDKSTASSSSTSSDDTSSSSSGDTKTETKTETKSESASTSTKSDSASSTKAPATA
jgi:putative FmdB family regulatory protein